MPTDFTPLASLGGGILIGLASVLLMANFGRVLVRRAFWQAF
jgi:hypothetical protein